MVLFDVLPTYRKKQQESSSNITIVKGLPYSECLLNIQIYFFSIH